MKFERNLSKTEAFSQLRSLDLPKDNFAIFGSGPMFMHGIREISELGDLDLVAVGAAWDMAVANIENWGGVFAHNSNWDCNYITVGDIEIWNGWGPGNWDLEHLIAKADLDREGYRYVRLTSVLNWKLQMQRPKDLIHAEMIRKFLES